MKIVLINQEHAFFSGPGGAERSVQSIAEHFASEGHETTFISMIRRTYMRDMDESGLHSIRNINGVKTILVGKKSAFPSHSDLLTPIILAEQPDVVHTNVFHRAPQLWKSLGQLGIPLVHSLREYKLLCDHNMFNGVHDCGAQCDPCSLASNYAIAMSEHVDGVVGISRFTLERHLNRGFFEKAAVRKVIPNSFRLEREPDPKVFAPRGITRVGFLGRMHASKGINLIIDVFERLRPGIASLIMAGDLQDEEISDRIQTLSAKQSVEYLGFVNPSDFFQQVDVLLAPSIWHEPFGRIAIEALAYGVPVIATRRGGLADIVKPGETGWLFDPDVPDELITILEGLPSLSSDDMRNFKARCLSSACDYLPEIVGGLYLDVYREAREARRARTSPSVNRVRAVYEKDAQRADVLKVLRTNRTSRERRPLKALIVTGEFPKLSETFVLNHVTGLIDLGVDVRVLYTKNGTPDQTPADFSRYRLYERVASVLPQGSDERAFKNLSRESHVIGSRLGLTLASTSLKDPKVAATFDEARRTLDGLGAQLRDLHGAQVLARLASDVDVIHCHFGHRPKAIYRFMDLAGLKIPVICSFHGIDMSAHIQTMGRSLYDDIKQRLHKALPISDFFRARLISLGFDPKDVQVHRVGVDCTKFQFAERKRAEGEPLRLISVGRCVHKKGFEFGIRAIARLLADRPDLPVIYSIIGDGTEMPKLRSIVNESGLEQNVLLLGSKPHTYVTQALAESHAMLAPSVTGPDGDMEGIPTVTMEAMASGLPVVSTFHSGIPEAVIDGYTGLLAPECDDRSLAVHIARLYDEQDLGSRLGRQGRLHVLANFNIHRQNERVLELYERITFGGLD